MAQLRRPKLTRKNVAMAGAATAALAAALVVPRMSAGGLVLESGGGAAQSAAETSSEALTEASTGAATTVASVLVVHVDGAVVAPGVYELAEGSRVNDAVEMAGGLGPEADTSTINLAALLVDGQKVSVPKVGESSGAVSGTATATDTGSQNAATGLVNINTASEAELDTVPGVGTAIAAAIIHDRETTGPFTSIEDLMRIDGIGEKKFAKMKDYICV